MFPSKTPSSHSRIASKTGTISGSARAILSAHFAYLKESGLVSDTFEIPLVQTAPPFARSVALPAPPTKRIDGPRTAALNASACEPVRRTSMFAGPPDNAQAFVGGDENRLVLTALESLLSSQQAAANSLPKSAQELAPTAWPFNPLVLCGRSGIGKSLLSRCLLSHWESATQQSATQQSATQQSATQQSSGSASQSAAQPRYYTGDDWARDYVTAVREDLIGAWRDECRKTSFFVLDDIPQLVRQLTAQRELVLLLDDLLSDGVPIIATLPVDPIACDGLLPGLASRLSGGLLLKLQPPGPHARQRIIGQMAQSFPRNVTIDAQQWFAEQFSGSVPMLQQALLGCLARAETGDDHHSQEITRSELRRLHSEWMQQQSISLKAITKSVSRYCQISVKEMIGASRRHSIVQARSLAMYLAKQLSGQSLRAIGQHFGNRDHTTVLHACAKIESTQATDPTLRMAVDELSQILRCRRGDTPAS